ncbi:putative type IX secretion system sortase PorU2 [Dyadobacter aurulentus]|uniref:putative type IX secretion system sortase PorU2 n=1 Tax=Dyadobacter sp. UC 10 TaxID=2605428 RepID=UPI0011F2F84C|nr:C25 family cysteine peptidase [Dyadobacter sp. UC 10]KAA0990962.1 T9SS type A sorting domain-containing protein [Dyadobacter sp. UC 10]
MYKATHIILLVFFCQPPLHAQRLFGNEWINTQQHYFKIPIVKTGFYQVTAQDLSDIGIPVPDIPANAFQIFRDGKEIAIEISDSGFVPLNADGFLRFYGEKNDGRRDTSLYVMRQAMPHSYYSLFSDTTFYFLTWRSDGGSGKRIAQAGGVHTGETLLCHREETLQLYTSHYLPGRFYPDGSGFEDGSALSDYDTGEGWTGPEIKEKTIYEMPMHDLADIPDQEIEIEIMLAGWTAGAHSFDISIEKDGALPRKIANDHFNDYGTWIATFLLKKGDLSENGTCRIAIVPVTGSHISVSYLKLSYLQESKFAPEEDQKLFHFKNSQQTWKCVYAPNTTFYDCTNPDLIRKLIRQNKLIYINGARRVIGVREYLPVASIRPAHFQEINASNADYLIITHPLLRVLANGTDPVEAYASYRASPQGGGYKPLIININTVFDQFNFGQRGPQGTKNLIAWLRSSGALKFVLLIGKSIDPQKARKIRNPSQTDLIPNAGWPGSDVALVTDPTRDILYPVVPVGRIGAITPQQVLDYLTKVKSLEAQPYSAEWRKNILHLSGGRSRQELSVFKSYVQGFEQKLNGSILGARIETVSKESDDPVEHIPLYRQINRGAALVTLFGHSAPDITDIDIGYASNEKNNYNNHPNYPAVIINGCAAGSIFYSDKTLSSDWIFSPKNGAVLFLAHTFNGVSTALKRYTDIFYEVLADPRFTSQPFGTIQQEAIKRNMQRKPDIYDSTTVQQMTLHGDPAIRIFPAQLPDYSFDSTYLRLSLPAKSGDQVIFKVIVKNNGRNLKQTPKLTFRRWDTDKLVYRQVIECKAVAVADTIQFQIPGNPAFMSTESFEFVLDEENLIPEENDADNRIVYKYWRMRNDPAGSDIVPPLLTVHIGGRQLTDGEQINRNALLQIRLFDADAEKIRTDTSGIFIWLQPLCQGCPEKRLYLESAKFNSEDLTHFYLETHLPQSLPAGKYLLTARARDAEGNYAPDYQIHFSLGHEPGIHFFKVYPNPSSDTFHFNFKVNGINVSGLVNISIYDITGKIVRSFHVKPHIGNNELLWKPVNQPAGIYIYRISASEAAIPVSIEGATIDNGRLLWFP